MIHNNSRESYEKCKKDKDFRRMVHRIAFFFEAQSEHTPDGFTDRQVKDHMYVRKELPFDDMNMVRPKITKLIKDGMLEECGEMFDKATQRHVRKVRWKDERQQPYQRVMF